MSDWDSYADLVPFIATIDADLSVIEAVGGASDGRRNAVLEITGSLNFSDQRASIRILIDQETLRELVTAAEDTDNLLATPTP